VTHLGSQLSALADGQLAPEAAERALAHVAGCPECAEGLAAARAAREALAAAREVCPDPELTARLLALGALRLEPVHPPRAARTAPLATSSMALPGTGAYRGSYDGSVLPRKRPVLPVAAAVVAIGLVSAAYVMGGEPDVSVDGHPVAALSALSAAAVAVSAPARGSGSGSSTDPAAVDLDGWLASHPWAADVVVPEGHRVAAVRATDDELEVDLDGPDGLVVLRQLRGRLAHVGEVVRVAGRNVVQVAWSPTCLAWQSGDAVMTVVAEGPRSAVEPVVAAYPVQAYDAGAPARVGRGWQLLMTAWSGE
jgi:anti-sigma factor RsiW